MQILRLDDSCTAPCYELRFDTPLEAGLLDSQLLDAAESFNFGGRVIRRNHEQALIQVFVD